MSRQETEGSILPPLERRIVLCLAEKGLQTINEIVKNIPILGLARRCHYKPTWLAINRLCNKGVIHEAGVKEYRGRKYPKFWLTGDGAVVAFTEGAVMKRLLELTRQVYPDNQTLACYLEVASKMNPDVIRILYSALRRSGRLEPADLALVYLTEIHAKDRDQRRKAIIETLRAYPEQYDSFRKRMEELITDVDKIRDVL